MIAACLYGHDFYDEDVRCLGYYEQCEDTGHTIKDDDLLPPNITYPDYENPEPRDEYEGFDEPQDYFEGIESV